MKTGLTSGESQVECDETLTADQLFPLVYDELESLAAAKLAREKPGHVLQASALVHEAYLRLASSEASQRWESQAHFFAAATEAMRRILIEMARRKKNTNRINNQTQSFWEGIGLDASATKKMDLLDMNDAISRLAEAHPQHARIVKLRFVNNLTYHEIAIQMNLSIITVKRRWHFAKQWLHRELVTVDDSRC